MAMIDEQTARYRTGTWTAVVTASGSALLHPSYAEEDVIALWQSMAGGSGIGEWLETLAGGGITGLADFALVQRAGSELRVLVRGGAVVIAGDQAVRAEGMSTWREAVVSAAPSSVTILAGDDVSSADEHSLPLVGGVVRADALTWGALDETSGPSPALESQAASSDVATPVGGDPEPATDAPADRESGSESGSDPEAAPEPGVPAEPEESEPAVADSSATDSSPADASAADAGPPEPGPVSEATMHPGIEPSPELPAESGIIDSLPWSVRSSQPSPPPAPFTAPGEASATASADDDVDVDEHTIKVPRRGGETGPAAPPAPAADGAWEGDHDGSTVLVSDVAAMRDATVTGAPGESAARSGEPATSQQPESVLLLSTGIRVPLDRPVLIGRAPESSRFAAGVEPRLVTVASPQQDISRTHVELRREGDHLLVTDLNSTNGTIVVLPGSAPRRLHAGEAVPVRAGTTVDLGDGVTGTIETPAP